MGWFAPAAPQDTGGIARPMVGQRSDRWRIAHAVGFLVRGSSGGRRLSFADIEMRRTPLIFPNGTIEISIFQRIWYDFF